MKPTEQLKHLITSAIHKPKPRAAAIRLLDLILASHESREAQFSNKLARLRYELASARASNKQLVKQMILERTAISATDQDSGYKLILQGLADYPAAFADSILKIRLLFPQLARKEKDALLIWLDYALREARNLLGTTRTRELAEEAKAYRLAQVGQASKPLKPAKPAGPPPTLAGVFKAAMGQKEEQE